MPVRTGPLLSRRAFSLGITETAAAAYSFPQNTTVLDDFNRADSSLSPTANWTAITNGGIKVISNAVGVQTDNFTADARWIGSSFNADQEAWMTVVTKIGATGNIFGLYTRLNLLAASGYLMFLREVAAGTDEWKIFSYTAGTPTQIGSTVTGPELAAGDKIGFSAIGTALKGYVFQSGVWTTVISGTDSTWTGAGHIGITISNDTNDLGRADNFGGGSIV